MEEHKTSYLQSAQSSTYVDGVPTGCSKSDARIVVTLFTIVLLSCLLGFLFERYALLVDLSSGAIPIRIVKKNDADVTSQEFTTDEKDFRIMTEMLPEVSLEDYFTCFGGYEVMPIPEYALRYYDIPAGLYVISEPPEAGDFLKAGDIITGINDSLITNRQDYFQIDTTGFIFCRVYRNGEYYELHNEKEGLK